MKIIISDKLPRVIKAKKELEKQLKIKITNRGKEVKILGKPEDEYIAEKVIDAINFGFPISTALLIKKEDYLFEILLIKNYTKRHDLERIKARMVEKLEEIAKMSREKAKEELMKIVERNHQIYGGLE